MNPQDLSRLGRPYNPKAVAKMILVKEDGSVVILPIDDNNQKAEVSSSCIRVKLANLPHASATGIAMRSPTKYKTVPTAMQTALCVARRADIKKWRASGVQIRIVGKATTILHGQESHLKLSMVNGGFEQGTKFKKTGWLLNHAVTAQRMETTQTEAAYAPNGLGNDLYIVEFIQAEQASIARDEQALAERKKRLAKLVEAHKSSTSHSSSSEKATQPSCRFHHSVNEKDLALSLKAIYEKYFKKPTSMKLLSNFDSVSDFTAMLYIILVGCGVVINKQATPFCEFINLQVWTLDATSRTIRNHLNQLLGSNQDAETFKIEDIRNEKLKQDFQNLKRCFQKSHFYGGISELLDNKE